FFPSVPPIGQAQTAFGRPGPSGRRITVVNLGRRQNCPPGQAVLIDDGVPLEANEPALAALAEGGSRFSNPPHSPVPQRRTDRNWLALHPKPLESFARPCAAGQDQQANHRAQSVPARPPLLVATQMGKGAAGIGSDQIIGPAQSRATKVTLHQSKGSHFGIAELGGAVVGSSPLSKLRMMFQALIDEVIDFNPLFI